HCPDCLNGFEVAARRNGVEPVASAHVVVIIEEYDVRIHGEAQATASARRRPSTRSESKHVSAIPRAAAAWRRYRVLTSSTAATAPSRSAKLMIPSPVGMTVRKPVS